MSTRIVYFVEAVGLNRIKIGSVFTQRSRIGQQHVREMVEYRVKELGVGCPVELRIVAISGRYDERQLHKRFDQYRIKGEWFEGVPEIWALVEWITNGMRTNPRLPADQPRKAVA